MLPMLPNEHHIRLWVDALRSGKYSQGRSRLARCSPDEGLRYCCLGVACEVAREHGVNLTITSENFEGRYPNGELFGGWFRRYDECPNYLPEKVHRWLGLEERDPDVAPALRASRANDYYEWTFEHVATALEFTYLGREGVRSAWMRGAEYPPPFSP